MRVALILSYNGKSFLGSQTQTQTHNTVFGVIEKALQRLGIEQKPSPSGRTDKGVHASFQVAHLDLPPYWSDTQKLHARLNALLPGSIHVKRVLHVKENFHARYDATSRAYRYIIKTSKPSPFEDDFVSFIPNVEFEALKEKIKLFLGEHDFALFMKSGSDTKSSVRQIYSAFAYKQKGYIILYFEANGFLRSQIRLMVAALCTLEAAEITEMLTCEQNYRLKPAPPNGLYLSKIKYKDLYV